jgi:5,5'-dehydrodivanillate O-demethylase
LQSYPAQALGGLVFIYMGPPPAPALPRWDVLVWTDGHRKLQRQPVLNCNWLQPQENSADVTHTYFLHSHALYTQGNRDRGTMRLYRPFKQYGFQPFEWGQIKGWQYGANDEWPAERAAGNPLIFPNILRNIGGGAHDMHWRVPVDDTHTLVFVVHFDPNQPSSSPAELENPPLEDHPPQYLPDGRHAMNTFWAHDRMAWETQGRIVNRGREHLGASDRGIILFRQMLKDQIERVRQGLDPLGVIREPDHDIIELPMWIVDDSGTTGEQFASQAGIRKIGQSMSDYFDERQEWFEVPDGPARRPGTLT